MNDINSFLLAWPFWEVGGGTGQVMTQKLRALTKFIK